MQSLGYSWTVGKQSLRGRSFLPTVHVISDLLT